MHTPWKAIQIHAYKHLYSGSKAAGEAGLKIVGEMLTSPVWHLCDIPTPASAGTTGEEHAL